MWNNKPKTINEKSGMEQDQKSTLADDIYTHAELKDELLGQPGTSDREWFEQCLFAVPAPVLGFSAKSGM